MARVGFLSSSNLDGFEVDDDLTIEVLREKHEIEVETPAWDQPQDWDRFDLIVVRSTWDYQKQPERFLQSLEQIESSRARLFNPLALMKWNLHKRYLKDLEERGISIVPTEILATPKDLDKLRLNLDLHRAEKWLFKPAIGAGSIGIEITGKDFGTERAQQFISAGQETLVQPYLPEITQGEVSLHFFSSQFSHAIRKVPKKGDFRVQEEWGGDIQVYAPNEDELNMGEECLDVLEQECLYARVDFVPYKGQPALMELELIEPSMYLRMDPHAPDRFAEAILKKI